MYEDVKSYVEQEVLTATPSQLIDMLYERAIRDLTSAHELLVDRGDPLLLPKALQGVIHAQRIITELQRSLNLKEGGELARNLSRIYEYLQFRLTESVKERSSEGVLEVAGLLTELHEGWRAMGGNSDPASIGRGAGGILVA